MAYIIDRYDKYNSWDRQHRTYSFELNGQQYAIFEVELEWGLPILEESVEYEKKREQYQVYGTKEEAMKFVWLVKGFN